VSAARSALAALARFWRDQEELHERLLLQNRPWEERYLHWVGEGDDRRLHGHLAPPTTRRRYGVTRGGWCLGQARESLEHSADR
jgi:hypothetical protein